MSQSRQLILNKEDILKRFFLAYGVDVNGDLFGKSKEQVKEHLDGCTYISCVANATTIEIEEFLLYGIEFFANNKYEDILEDAFSGVEEV